MYQNRCSSINRQAETFCSRCSDSLQAPSLGKQPPCQECHGDCSDKDGGDGDGGVKDSGDEDGGHGDGGGGDEGEESERIALLRHIHTSLPITPKSTI